MIFFKFKLKKFIDFFSENLIFIYTKDSNIHKNESIKDVLLPKQYQVEEGYKYCKKLKSYLKINVSFERYWAKVNLNKSLKYFLFNFLYWFNKHILI